MLVGAVFYSYIFIPLLLSAMLTSQEETTWTGSQRSLLVGRFHALQQDRLQDRIISHMPLFREIYISHFFILLSNLRVNDLV